MSATSLLGRPKAVPRAPRVPWVASARRRVTVPVAVALVVVTFLAVLVAFPGVLARFDPYSSDLTVGLRAPSGEHWFGTDRLGRDVWSRVVHGARYSVLIGLAATAIGVVLGTVLGVSAGLSGAFLTGRVGRWLDEGLTRLLDVVSSFPAILLAMLVVTFTGPGVWNVAVAIGIAGIPLYARVVRSQTFVVTRADYVAHAAVFGRSRWAVLGEHVLPNALTAVPVLAAIDIGTSILAVSGLSFLGLGPQPPIPEWGVMLAESRDVLRVAWWAGVFPGVFITGSVIAFTVLGRWLQARTDGRQS
ncbi:ABC transporter permease [Xylanimonas protaetiae]|uniref:ABC transporter permease n=1 Tax=Xylanimonas protaetiae TaxID=2509457 RepID=A0A4P6F7C3_9MICO|nr:ABC transporter permease [Xylanimonas protaetiae]QAY71594.1 ABC transporter permease [Xylanimonas protaetiae]